MLLAGHERLLHALNRILHGRLNRDCSAIVGIDGDVLDPYGWQEFRERSEKQQIGHSASDLNRSETSRN
jgi:hypothetical protein